MIEVKSHKQRPIFLNGKIVLTKKSGDEGTFNVGTP